jgi:hypothetical protein
MSSMKAISAAIVSLAGAVIVEAGLSGLTDPHHFAFFVGCIVTPVGLLLWAKEFFGRTDG